MNDDQKGLITIFEKDIKYDPSKIYGIFTAKGNYESLTIDLSIPRWASSLGESSFIPFLKNQIINLSNHLENNEVFEAISYNDVLRNSEHSENYIQRSQELRNTIDLFEDISLKLK